MPSVITHACLLYVAEFYCPRYVFYAFVPTIISTSTYYNTYLSGPLPPIYILLLLLANINYIIYLSAYTAVCKPLMHQLLYYTLRYIRLHIIIMWVRGTLLRCSTLSRWWSEMKKMSLCTRPRAVVRVRVRCGMRDDGRLLCSGKNNGPNLPASVLSPHDDDAFCRPAASIILLYRLILFVGINFFFRFVFIVVVRSIEIPQTTCLLFL